MDPATGSALIAGMKALYDMAKANKDPKMMDQLLEIQGHVYNLVNENQALTAENGDLKAKLAQKVHVELRDDGAMWRKGDKAAPAFGGFCPNCFNDNGKLIKLNCDSGDRDMPRSCGVCKHVILGKWF